MELKTFYQECVKRKVFKGISIYAISSWLIIQVAATTFPYLGFPNEAVSTVIILVLLCFPISIIFSWYYNVEREPDDIARAKSLNIRKESNRVFFGTIGLITAIVLILIFMVSQKSFKRIEEVIEVDYTSDQVAVLQFKNNTTDTSLDVIGKMVADWISHGIIQNEVAPVLNYESINQLASIGNKANILQGNLTGLSSITSFSKLIKGAFFVDQGELIFQSEIIDKISGKQFAFPIVKCSSESPLVGIEKIKQQILSYFRIDKKDISGDYIPRYDAYKEFILAKDHWVKDYDLANGYLDKALKIDPNFYQAAYYKTILNHNLLNYAIADSLVNLYTQRYGGMDMPSELFSHLRSMIDGKYQEGLRKYESLFRKQPSDLFDNTAMLVMMQVYVNQVDDFDEVYNLINVSELDFSKCTYCNTRISQKAYADITKGKSEEAQILLENHTNLESEVRYSEALIKAYVQQQKFDLVDEYFDDPSIKLLEKSRQAYLFFIAGWESALINNKEMRDFYTDKSLSIYNEFVDNPFMKGRCLYLIEKYDEAYLSFQENLDKKEGKSALSLSRMAAIDYLKGRDERAEQLVTNLMQLKEKYDYGNNEYFLAHIAAKRGYGKDVFLLLEEALLNGKYYGHLYFQNDPHLAPFHNAAEFKKLLTYWH